MSTLFDTDSRQDQRARKVLERETKAAAFDYALEAAKDAPKIARERDRLWF
jgi:hypothetical protein